MTIIKRPVLVAMAALVACTGLSWGGETGSLVSSAEARIGRPRTPMSYAGVARRTTRRAIGVGAVGAAAPGAYYYSRPGCPQVVDAYGRVYRQC
jgi:hypothetical protein